MDIVLDANELVRRLRAYGFTTAPDPLAARIQAMPGVQAQVITDGAELLYAFRDVLDDEGLTILAQLFAYAIEQHWDGFNAGDRSARIVALSRRDLGEKGASVAKAKDSDWPAPKAELREGLDWRAPEQAEAPVDLANPTPKAAS